VGITVIRNLRRNSTIEPLEPRQLLATVSVNASQVLRSIDSRMVGTNLAWWQFEQDTPTMRSMISAAGLKLFRMPGGSSTNDNWHFNNPPPYSGYKTAPIMANVIQGVGGDCVVTVNYGTASPQEAAAELAYFNAPVGSTVNIGTGIQWSTTSNSWVSKDWKTAGYWASLRAATPLATDDGLNFLRMGHAQPWNFSYYEVGNEDYATWENDKHSAATGTGAPQDPATYIGFAKTFSTLAVQIDSDVKIGLDVSLPLQFNMPDSQWTDHLLQQSVSQGFVPGFLSDHVYVGGLSDQNLLLHSVNDPNYLIDFGQHGSWASRASYYRTRLNQDLGANAAGVQLMLTEFNSDINTKQAANLPGGLWLADALGGLAQTEYTGAIEWDLTNGYTAKAADATHYGWREGVDMGLISTGSGPAPASGAYVPYPVYFGTQLWSKLAVNGGSVVTVSSNDANLSAYAVKQSNGHLDLLIINKSSSNTLSGTFNLSGYLPASSAQFFQYGKTEDTAQSLTSNGAASLTSFSQSLGLSGSSFTKSFAPYSMTVIDLSPAAPPQAIANGFVFQTSPNQVQVTFDEDVSMSLAPSDLTITNAGGGSAPVAQSVVWNGSTNTATFTLSPGVPVDANYNASVSAGAVANVNGTPSASGYNFSFFVLAADANRDKTVDLTDFTILAANFNTSGKNFSQGNFSYDGVGTVDLTDFTILAANFNDSLPASSVVQSASVAPRVESLFQARLDREILDLI
jgi:hypothetical protein